MSRITTSAEDEEAKLKEDGSFAFLKFSPGQAQDKIDESLSNKQTILQKKSNKKRIFGKEHEQKGDKDVISPQEMGKEDTSMSGIITISPVLIQSLTPYQRDKLRLILDMVPGDSKGTIRELQRRLEELIKGIRTIKAGGDNSFVIEFIFETNAATLTQAGATLGSLLIINMIADKMSLSFLSLKAKYGANNLIYRDRMPGNEILKAWRIVIQTSTLWSQTVFGEPIPQAEVESFFSWVHEALIGKSLIESSRKRKSVYYQYEDYIVCP